MQVQGTVMARNRMEGPTIMSSDPRGTYEVLWQGKGDPNGGDVQIVPETIVNTPAFQRALNNGVLLLIEEGTDVEAREALAKQAAAFAKRSTIERDEILDNLDHQPDNDMLSVPCIGPNNRGGKCDADVVVRQATQHDAPPLCTQHKYLAGEFVKHDENVYDGPEKKRQVSWTRTVVTARNELPPEE